MQASKSSAERASYRVPTGAELEQMELALQGAARRGELFFHFGVSTVRVVSVRRSSPEWFVPTVEVAHGQVELLAWHVSELDHYFQIEGGAE
jgi:hypothetical protein